MQVPLIKFACLKHRFKIQIESRNLEGVWGLQQYVQQENKLQIFMIKPSIAAWIRGSEVSKIASTTVAYHFRS